MTNPLAIRVQAARERAFQQRRDANAPAYPMTPGLPALHRIMAPGNWRTLEQEKAEWEMWRAEAEKMYRGEE